MTVPSLYGKHRKWALSIAEELDDTDEGRLVALVALWEACREYEGHERFKPFAEPMIKTALLRRVEA